MNSIIVLKPVIIAVAALIGLYVLYQAFKALFYFLSYITIVVIAATPFFLLVIGVLFGLNYENPYNKHITIKGIDFPPIPTEFSFLIVLIGMFASVGFFYICVRSKVFKTINQKFNPLPPPTESVQVDLSHLIPKK